MSYKCGIYGIPYLSDDRSNLVMSKKSSTFALDFA